MKKFYLLAFFVSTLLAGLAQPMTGVWTKYANVDFPWFSSNNNVRGMDYNKATGHLLVSDMNNNIYILDANDGTQLGTLSRTGLGVESFRHIRIRVTDDGVIYGISLQTGAGTCTIYRWANEGANPTIAAAFSVNTRTGDALGISGTGSNTIIYACGTGTFNSNTEIYMLTTPNGIQFVRESVITVASGASSWANRTVEPVTNSRTSDLWIKTSSGAARRVTVGDNVGGVRVGTVAATTPPEIPVGGFAIVNHFVTTNGKKFLAFAASSNATPANPQNAFLRVYDVTNEANVTFYGIDSLYGDPANEVAGNGNSTGDIAVREEANGEFTIFWMATNNAIKATKTGLQLLPVNFGRFDAKLVEQGALLTWNTTTETNNTGFEIEKSYDGVQFAQIGYVASKAANGNSTAELSYEFADQKLGEGKSFYRLKQVDKDGKFSYSPVRMVQKVFSNQFGARVRNNPVNSQLNLSINSAAAGKVFITLTNASGGRVLQTVQNVSAGETNINLSAAQLPQGVYYVTVAEAAGKNQQTTIKIVKN